MDKRSSTRAQQTRSGYRRGRATPKKSGGKRRGFRLRLGVEELEPRILAAHRFTEACEAAASRMGTGPKRN
jgi:hypothetical protein